jgi:hypothetical protein
MDKETVSHNMQTYDTLGNERSKAICELRKINVENLCKQYDYIDVYAQYVWAIGESLGLEGGGGFESIIERLIHLLGGDAQGEEPTRETYTGLTVKMGKPAETSDYEDTREKLVEDIKSTQWCVSLKDVLGWLDRQAAITEREVREALEQTISAAAEEAEQAFNDTRRLSATIEKQRDVIARAKVAYDTVRGLFDGWEE